MPKKRKEDPIDPKNLKPEDKMKFEIAAELGLADKVIAGGWRSLTAKERRTHYQKTAGAVCYRARCERLKKHSLQEAEKQFIM